MDLPFSPTFFRKIDTYQQLRNFESEGKPIWEAEKLVLEWAAGPGHAHPGSYLNTGHVKRVLEKAQDAGRLPKEAEVFANNEPQHVLNSLENRGLGVKYSGSEPDAGNVRIISGGLIAGQVLKETELLHKRWKYEVWTGLWWGVLFLGFILLISQTASVVVGILSR